MMPVTIFNNFFVSSAQLVENQKIELEITTTNPAEALHAHSFVFGGSMKLDIGEYTKNIGVGETTRFTPRSDAGLPPWPVGTIFTMTALSSPTYYICVYNKDLTLLSYQTRVLAEAETVNLTAGNLIIPIDDVNINGVVLTARSPRLVESGDVLSGSVGSRAMIFSV